MKSIRASIVKLHLNHNNRLLERSDLFQLAKVGQFLHSRLYCLAQGSQLFSKKLISGSLSSREYQITNHKLIFGNTIKHSEIHKTNYSTVMAEQNVMNGISTEETQQNTAVLQVNNAQIPAILRYEAGSERYQFTCLFHNKTFNFNRSSVEPISAFFERFKSNISKKVKHFEGNVNLLVDDEVLDACETLESILNKFDWQRVSRLNIQIDNEILNVSINPPEIDRIKFLKSALVGFPILPAKLEGSPNFNPKLSKYIWQFTKVGNEELQKMNMKNYKKAKAVNAWSACPTKIMENGSHEIAFVPPESLVGALLRLTCVPSNDGINFGNPLTVEMPMRVSSSERKFLYEERVSRLDEKPTVESCPEFLRIVTYNALADTYATKEWFTASPEESLHIDYRLPIINHELAIYQGDIICLQEVDDKYYENYFEPFLSTRGYNGSFSCKVSDTKEGIAMFYNKIKFNELESNTLVIGEHMKTLDFYETILLKYDNIIKNLNERNTVLQVVVLESLVCPERLLIVANTHLYFHPDADHIRLLQTITSLKYLETKLAELKLKYPSKNISVLFCGDFNCTPPYSSFRAITTGRIEESDFDWTSHETEKLSPGINFSHNLNLINSHPAHELTNIVINFEGCLDYIFYQESMKLLKVYSPPSKATIAKFCGIEEESKVSLPNLQCPSDHVPLIADFKL